jgi:hypothetical protein
VDRTVLTLAVDSSQVGTAAAAFDRMVNAGNSAATSAGRVTSATLAQGRTIAQTLVPALNNGINRTRTLDETQAALGQDASRQFGQQLAALRARANMTSTSVRDAVTNERLPSEQGLPRVVSTVRPTSAAPAVAPAAQTLGRIGINGTNGITQLASAAAVARLAIERLTEAANGSRTAFTQVTQAAEGAARTYRQQNQAQVTPPAAQTPSTAAVALSAAPQASPNAMREVAQAMSATATQATRAASAVTEANRAIAATPRITASASAVSAARAPLVAQPIVSAATGQRVPTAAAPVAQLAADAGRAQTTVERLTAAARSQRSALTELAPAASAAASSYRQIAATPIRMEAPQGISATAAALANVAVQAQNADRAITGLNRTSASSVSQSTSSQTISRQSTSSTTTNVGGSAPDASRMNAFAAAATRGTTAVNGFAAAEGRAAEAAQHLAEANARNEAAQARLAAAIQRVAAAQAQLDNASRPGSAGTDAVAQAQTRLQSAQAAVSVATANVARTQRGAAEATERHRIALQATGRQSTLTANQTQQLHFQLHDFFVQVASGQSPLTAFIQQGSQLSGTFGGAGGAFRAVMSLLTPTVLAFGAGAVAVGGFALALSKAESAARSLNGVQAQLAGTGRGSMFSDAELRAYLAKLSELPGVTRETATAIVTELAKVHEIGGTLFKDLAALSVDYAKATGKEAPEAARELARAFADPKRGAEQLDAALGALSSTQLLQIDQLVRLGDTAGAQKIMFEALQGSVQGLADRGLTPLQKSVNELGNSWDRAMRSMEASEGLRTSNRLLAQVVGWAKYLIDHSESLGSVFSKFTPVGQVNSVAALVGGQSGAAPGKREVSGKITSASPAVATTGTVAPAAKVKTTAEIDKEIKLSIEAAKSYQSQAGKIEDLTDTRKRFNNSLSQSIALYGKDSEQAKALRSAIAGVDEQIVAARKKGGSEASQVLRAQLQNDLKSINDVFEKQRDAYQFQNAFVESAYRAGTVSLGELMQQRRETITNTAQAQIDALNQEQTRLQQALKQEKDPSTRVQLNTRINEIDVEREKVETRKTNDVTLLNQEETASFKQLSEQVTNYRANLLQMQGDEAGAAALRAQTVIANAKVLAAQATGLPGAQKVDVEGLTRAITLTDQFNEVQRQTSLLTSTSTRAEEAYLLVADQSGKSLMETERGLYALRSSELAQLGALAAKAKELADASTDPKIKAFAADLALEYAKAANAVDPALNRLRDANRELAAGLAQSIGNAPNAFVEFYSQRRSQSEQDIKSQKDEYEKRIDQLRGYLSQEKDERNKAVLRKRIDKLQGESDGLKVESKGKTALDALKKTVLEPAAQQVSAAISKVLIQEPLQKYLEGQLKGLTEGDGPLAGIFKKALGIEEDPKQQALLQQTAAIDASSSALDTLRAAAENAANALNKPLSGVKASDGQAGAAGEVGQTGATTSSGDSAQPPPVDSDLGGTQSKATESLSIFDKQTVTTASDVLKLASAAGAGGNAMVRLPGIVGLFQSAVMAMTANSSAGSGGIGGFIAKLFGGGGNVASSGDYAANGWLSEAEGGYIQGPGTGTSDSIPARLSNGEFVMPAAKTKLFRPVLEQMRSGTTSVFDKAPKYHTGGIVGRAADKVAGKLAKDEVAAVLMGGPKGKREEVLHASDPRHRDNLGVSVVARILAESKAPKSPVAEAAKPSEPRSTVSTLIQSIAGSKGESESSASVLGGLLERLGVKDSEEAAPNAVRLRGARELGGPVSAGGMYRVNEKGPELLEVAGKQYLMMGSQGGKVDSNGSTAKGEHVSINVQVTAQPGMSRATAQQQGLQIGRGIELSRKRNG